MGCEGCDKPYEATLVPGARPLRNEFVDIFHQPGDGRIELHAVEVRGDLLDGPMAKALVGLFRRNSFLSEIIDQAIYPAQKPVASFDGARGPRVWAVRNRP